MEQSVVAKNEEVFGALVVGAQRLQAALLIELRRKSGSLTTKEQSELVERIWPTIKEANSVTPAHARVEKMLVLVTSPDKPIIRAGKGTIQRQATIEAYADEIDQLYAAVEADQILDSEDVETSPDTKDPIEIRALIVRSLKAVSANETFQDEDNLFLLGLDSLQSLQLARRLKKVLKLPELALSTIYSNPSVSKLVQATISPASQARISREKAMRAVLCEFQERLTQIVRLARPISTSSSQVVVLTGSTGYIGTHLLHVLTGSGAFEHIYCLNRCPDSLSAYRSRLGEPARH